MGRGGLLANNAFGTADRAGRTIPSRTSRPNRPSSSDRRPVVTGSRRATGRPRSTISTGDPPFRPSISALRLFLASVILAFFIIAIIALLIYLFKSFSRWTGAGAPLVHWDHVSHRRLREMASWLGGRDSNLDNVVQRAVHRLRCASVRAVSVGFPRRPCIPLRSVSVLAPATCLIVSQLPRRFAALQDRWGSHCTSRSCSPSSGLISGSPVRRIARNSSAVATAKASAYAMA